jgi:hypothetical protein
MKTVAAIIVAILICCWPATSGIESYRHDPVCPEDNCALMYNHTEFCVGMNCRTVIYYKCCCCGTLWGIYQ